MKIHTPDVEAFRTTAGEYMVKTYAPIWGEGFYEAVQGWSDKQ